MGFVVLHIQKPKGNDARTSAHIERTVNPANADQTRTHLNKKLIDYPDGVENRTQAIQYRIENASITRKIRDNQVRALQVMLSGTHEDMQRIQSAGKLKTYINQYFLAPPPNNYVTLSHMKLYKYSKSYV